MKIYRKKHKTLSAIENHMQKLKKRDAIFLVHTDGLTIQYWFEDQFIEFHNELVNKIRQIKGVVDVDEIFLNPNKYGDVTTTISFKHHVIDRWNYNKGEVSIDYKRNLFFIPEEGYIIFKEINTSFVLNKLIKHYKL